MNNKNSFFFDLLQTIATLRGENGCPWDQKQSLLSIKKYLREECEELIEAIDDNDHQNICEETGDMFFILILISQISADSGYFDINNVLQGINEKMIRRHPHVFANMPIGSEKELNKQWETIKSSEKGKKIN